MTLTMASPAAALNSLFNRSARSAVKSRAVVVPVLRAPVHLAIIMDGNGRWAKRRGMPRLAGHKAGTENLRRIITACVRHGVKILTLYAFSTENWSRPEDEVNGLMRILESVAGSEIDELDRNGVQIRHLGKLDRVPHPLQEKILQSIERTRSNEKLILNVALNYGGRAEILDAVKELIADGVTADKVDEAAIARRLYTRGLPDPDLVVRTSGEYRTSNFLVWQSAYSEYYFTDTFWPDFDEQELQKAIEHYSRRERRFGGVTAR